MYSFKFLLRYQRLHSYKVIKHHCFIVVELLIQSFYQFMILWAVHFPLVSSLSYVFPQFSFIDILGLVFIEDCLILFFIYTLHLWEQCSFEVWWNLDEVGEYHAEWSNLWPVFDDHLDSVLKLNCKTTRLYDILLGCKTSGLKAKRCKTWWSLSSELAMENVVKVLRNNWSKCILIIGTMKFLHQMSLVYKRRGQDSEPQQLPTRKTIKRWKNIFKSLVYLISKTIYFCPVKYPYE